MIRILPPRRIDIILLIFGSVFLSCSKKEDNIAATNSFRLIGEVRLALSTSFQGTQVGGISGIDMNPDGSFYLLSDDGSDINPARFYTAMLDYDASKFRSVTITGLTILKTPGGKTFQSFQEYMASSGGEYADPESIRFDATTNSLFYSSEGSNLNLNAPPDQPFIRRMDLQGNFLSEISTPDQFRYTRIPSTGLISNASFEAMSLIPGTNELWVAIEAPLLQDGSRPNYSQNGTPVRIARINWKTNEQISQYAYIPEKNPLAPTPSNGSDDNGIPEVLAIDANRLLVLERAFSTGYPISQGNTIRMYEVEFAGATDVKNISSLKGASYKSVDKKLVLDFSKSGLTEVDNIESMAWGKSLPNGNRTIVFVVDNNFNANQNFQFFVFEVMSL